MSCPACGGPMGDKILVCFSCWELVPRPDRIQMVRMYARDRKALTGTKAEKIIRQLREKRVAANLPDAQ